VISTIILGRSDSSAKSVARGGISQEKENGHHQGCCCSSSTDQTKVLLILILLRMGQEPKIHRGVLLSGNGTEGKLPNVQSISELS